MCHPLTELTKGKFTWSFGPEHQSAFDKVKFAISTAPTLALPDFSKPFALTTDASDFAVGAILSQDQGKGLQPIAFESRKLQPAQRNMSTADKEALAVIEALKRFRCYLESSTPFILYTDSSPLTYIKSKADEGRCARWLEVLSRFNIIGPKHIPGKSNPADALSRRPDHKDDNTKHGVYTTLNKDNDFELKVFTRSMHTSQLNLQPFEDAYPLDPLYSDEQNLHKYNIISKDDCYYQQGRLCVPLTMRTSVLEQCHNSPMAGHLGVQRTFDVIKREFWWLTMRQDIQEYVRACDICQRVKPSNQRKPGLLSPLPIPLVKWNEISMDFIGPFPKSSEYTTIFVVVDRLSKMSHFIPTVQTVTARQTAQLFMDHVVKLHGWPSTIVSDRDPRFTSDFWTSLMKHMKVHLNMSSADHPETDGQTERMNRTLLSMIRAFTNAHGTNWSTYLSMLEFAYNNVTHEGSSLRHSF